jgi:hypothetical protein
MSLPYPAMAARMKEAMAHQPVVVRGVRMAKSKR